MGRQILLVPKGTQPKRCKGPVCTKLVWWIMGSRGGRMPVDCDAGEGCKRPTSTEDGGGVPHWGTCADAKSFRQPKPELPQ